MTSGSIAVYPLMYIRFLITLGELGFGLSMRYFLYSTPLVHNSYSFEYYGHGRRGRRILEIREISSSCGRWTVLYDTSECGGRPGYFGILSITLESEAILCLTSSSTSLGCGLPLLGNMGWMRRGTDSEIIISTLFTSSIYWRYRYRLRVILHFHAVVVKIDPPSLPSRCIFLNPHAS